MASLYNFTRLIKRYSRAFSFVPAAASTGKYSGGDLVPGPKSEPVIMSGAIVPLSEQKIYQSGGSYTTQDRQLYLCRPLPDALKGASVEYQGHNYSVEQDTDWSAYADVYVYLLKRVSKFENSKGG